jgi:hypothetical protein
MENVGIFYGHLVHFTVFCYILWTFGIVRGNLVYIFPALVFCTKKNLATLVTNARFLSRKGGVNRWQELPKLLLLQMGLSGLGMLAILFMAACLASMPIPSAYLGRPRYYETSIYVFAIKSSLCK